MKCKNCGFKIELINGFWFHSIHSGWKSPLRYCSAIRQVAQPSEVDNVKLILEKYES